MINMTKEERKTENLTKAVEEYSNSTDKVVDIIYKLIDKECRKTNVSIEMSKHKQKLKRLENLLKTY